MNQLTTTPEIDTLIEKIIVWIFDEEKKKAKVIELTSKAAPEFTPDEVNELINMAFTTVAELHKQENDPLSIINQHIEWYEKIYRYFQSIDHAAGMNKAMQAKERLLGILQDQNKVVLKKETTFIQSRPAIEYDLSKLTPAERERLDYLISLMKVDE